MMDRFSRWGDDGKETSGGFGGDDFGTDAILSRLAVSVRG